jgi:repressor LexA
MHDLRKKMGMTQLEVAQKMHITERMYSRYESGAVAPSVKRLRQFADIVGTSLQDLLSDRLYVHPFDEEIKMYKVPLVHTIPAGGFQLGFDMPVEEYVISPVADKNAFALRAKGNSMEPVISDGDIVICTEMKEFIDNKYYAVVTKDSEATLKRVKKIDDGYLLIPYNDEYDPIYLPARDLEKLYKVSHVIHVF